ncbi:MULTISPECIES: PilZ domain-containing protein [Aliivibrio]|uniref:PilZ domain-containing protein n=2 Tax=Aliivibrio TaxID=511678 RepID=A0A4Q5KPB4_9GAMM|nr:MULTISPECIES: PilZ domain-containing protein [Aliivibrio]MDD9177395.1 PilZ domain-containing protein [Aliivibrio sp. A6]RYU46722.1 PilZ domain-containing protein [Aliivibrio finisterrensis]RYU54160.1 PilZ domain-containing protein [Aliivibrio finisterrensis]RYU56066.1 PilZ domain-containing protein [Aliivibrio finisterrensis]RYU61121.1 PilZ domain-containing protein [Aliivibrio finisterrensis]
MQQEEYQSYVEQLIPVFGEPDFELVCNQVMSHEHASIHLIVKIELKRIMTPCKKSIDLRGRVKGQCHQYELDGYTHWLDDVAINTYHKSIERYGSYTEGVWEALTNTRNNFRVLHKNKELISASEDKNEEGLFKTKLIRFGHYLTRSENRLRMSTQVTVLLPNGNLIHGTSSDLSSSGARIKVPAAFEYGLGQIIQVSFPTLAKETGIKDLNGDFPYRILGIHDSEESDSYRWLRLKMEANHDVIAIAIDEKLNKNKRRTLHDQKDQVVRARTQGYEHCFLRHTTNIPLFFSGDTLKYAILTDHNESLWKHWHDEKNQPVINHLFKAERMQFLTKPGLKASRTHFYSFKHDHEDRELFYSMMSSEGTQQERQLFWHIGAKRKSWKVIRLSLFELEKGDKERLLTVAPEMEGVLSTLTHMGILTEISLPETQKDYLLTDKPVLAPKELNPYRHATAPISQAHALYFDSAPRRTEPRFNYQTLVTLHHPQLGDVTGRTLDISINGLSIQLDKAVQLTKKSDVKVTFNDLQSLDKNTPLSRIGYHVLKVASNGINIQLHIEDSLKTQKSKAFLSRLIEHNIERLPMDYEQLPSMEMLKIMHQLLLNKLTTTPFFIEKDNHKIKTRCIGVNFPLNRLNKIWQHLGDENTLNLEPIFKTRVRQLLVEPLKTPANKRSHHHEIYLAVVIKDGKIKSVFTRMLQEFSSYNDRLTFIKKAKEHGEFLAIRVTTTAVKNPLSTTSESELSQLAQHAIHYARALENELSSIVGCGEIADITDEVLIRLELG